MAGYGLPNEQHLSVVLQNSLELEGHNIEIVNGSVSGSTSAGGLNIAEWTLTESNIDLMILGLGANDMLRGINPKDCLLYTSPSPRDGLLSRMPSSA